MPRLELRIREVDIEAGAKSKGSNGGVAVGLPHRNYSVFKQTPYQLMELKRRDPPSAVGGLRGIYKRVGSWGKKKRNGWNNSKREEGWELGEEKR